jgi:hypothetical protein
MIFFKLDHALGIKIVVGYNSTEIIQYLGC